MGLAIPGTIRVITNTAMVRHNAAAKVKRKRGPKFKAYTWKIANIFAPTPSLTISLR